MKCNVEPPGYPYSWDFSKLYDPRSWLFTKNDDWKATLKSLVGEVHTNPCIGESCSEIVVTLFLHPISTSDAEIQIIKDLAQNYPDYLKFYWNAVIQLPNENEKKQEALEYREKARLAQEDDESLKNILEQIFPAATEQLSKTSED